MIQVKVTAEEANNIVCPYTGQKLDVYMTVQPGSIVFNAPNAYSPHVPVDSIDELYDKASRRNGVAGMVTGNDLMKDPYSGEPFTLDQMPDGRFRFRGGFNPRMACATLGDFLYQATMRNGKATMNKPVNFAGVEKPAKTHIAKTKGVDVSEETAKAAEKAVRASGAFDEKTTVSFAGSSKKRGKAS